MDKLSALTLLSDLFSDEDQKKNALLTTNLFGEVKPTAPAKPKAAWKVIGLTLLHIEQSCACCGQTHLKVNPEVLVSEGFFSGDQLLYSHETTDIKMLKSEQTSSLKNLPVEYKTIQCTKVPFCIECIEEQASNDLLAVLLAQAAKEPQAKTLPKEEPEELVAAVSLDDLL